MANSTFTPTLEGTLAVMKKKGYRVYANEEGFDLNIVGIRTAELVANRFDDFLTVFYRMHGDWIFNVFKCTTDPGAFYLEHPIGGTMGTAILKEGQYRSSHRIGKHKGKYTALVQNSPLTVIRDANRDRVLDLDSGTEQTGMFGINIHRANEFRQSIQVEKWSAGCQVLADPLQFKFLMDICRKGREAFGNSFTYTLVHERDF
jgi:hypothetical protein